MNPILIGVMGFGRVGRQLYRLALDDDRFDVVAISDIGQPHILHHLLSKTVGSHHTIELDRNYLEVGDSRRA